MLDGGSLVWLMENPTYQLALNASAGGFLPLSQFPEVNAFILGGAYYLNPVINFSILFGQLAAIFCLAKRKHMIFATAFFDLTHIVIYLLSGIFFWKWILFNFALIFGIRKLPKFVETKSLFVAGVLAVLIAPKALQIIPLAWYDSPAVVLSETIVVTNDGKEFKVPSNYFGTISVSAAQHRFGRPEQGHFPTATWGTTQNKSVFEQARLGCNFDDYSWVFKQNEEEIRTLINNAHLYALQQEQKRGDYNYNLFPHHIWSNPFDDTGFSNLKISDINHYLYRTSSNCFVAADGAVAKDVHKSDEILIPLPN